MQIRKSKLDVEDSDSSNGCGVGVKFFDVGKVQDELPLPPSSYPENLHGLFWMDQAGEYGFANMSAPMPDYIVSFADAYKPLNPRKRTITVAPWGKAWTWFNTASGYVDFGAAKFATYVYNFHFNKDYTYAQIITEVQLGWFGKITVPTWAINANMRLQTPAPGTCPPPAGASKERISQCATWVRETTILPGMPFVSQPTMVYPLFRIADNQGNKIQPYYDAYLQWAMQEQNSEPDAEQAKEWLGVDLEKVGGMEPGQSFVGTKKATTPGLNLCNPAASCKNLWTPLGFSKCAMALVQDLGLI